MVSEAAFGRYLEPLLGILRCLLWMILKKYVCLCGVQTPHSAQTVCSPSNTLLAFSVSKFCLFRSLACFSNCLRVHARVLARLHIRSTTLAVGLVLRNSADAVQSSFIMRSLPQSVVRRNLLISISLFLWPGYPLIASCTLNGIFWMDGNCLRA